MVYFNSAVISTLGFFSLHWIRILLGFIGWAALYVFAGGQTVLEQFQGWLCLVFIPVVVLWLPVFIFYWIRAPLASRIKELESGSTPSRELTHTQRQDIIDAFSSHITEIGELTVYCPLGDTEAAAYAHSILVALIDAGIHIRNYPKKLPSNYVSVTHPFKGVFVGVLDENHPTNRERLVARLLEKVGTNVSFDKIEDVPPPQHAVIIVGHK